MIPYLSTSICRSLGCPSVLPGVRSGGADLLHSISLPHLPVLALHLYRTQELLPIRRHQRHANHLRRLNHPFAVCNLLEGHSIHIFVGIGNHLNLLPMNDLLINRQSTLACIRQLKKITVDDDDLAGVAVHHGGHAAQESCDGLAWCRRAFN